MSPLVEGGVDVLRGTYLKKICALRPRWAKELPSTRDAEAGSLRGSWVSGLELPGEPGWMTLCESRACLERILPWEK